MAPPAQPKAASSQSAASSFAALPSAAKAFILVFILAAIGVIYYVALHQPTVDSISTAEARHTQLEQNMVAARSRQQEFLTLREELAGREGIDRANLRVLPEASEMATFLGDLNRLAEMSGLSMRLVEPRPEEPGEDYVRLPVALHVAGRFHQLSRFFYNVSHLDRAISMENIHLAEPTVSGEDVLLRVEVLATTYRRPSEEAPADAAATPAATPAAGG